MASQITPGASDVAGIWSTYVLRKFVPGLKANLVFANYAEPASIPKGSGAYIARWNIPTMREGSTSALTDGSSGSATDMVTLTTVEATIQDRGEWMNIGDLANESSIPAALDSYKDIVAYAGATAIDRLIINAADDTTNFLHVGDTTTGGAALVAGNVLNAQDFPVVAGFFHANNAIGWDKLSGDYMMAIHPVAEIDLVTDVTTAELSWSEVNKHVPAGFEQLINTHRFVGRLGGVTALRTTMIATVNEDITAHVNLALARYGVGWLGLGESGPKAPKIIMKSPGPTSTNDPLDTNHTLGWKVRAVAALLDSSRALKVYSDAI